MNLPPYTFIIGPQGSGRTTLANLLWDADKTRSVISIDEPIREATLNLFYPEAMSRELDLRSPELLASQIPFGTCTVEEWMRTFRALIRLGSPNILGDLLKKRMNYGRVLPSTFLILDVDRDADVKPFASAYGNDACCLIFVERAGMPIAPLLSRFAFLRTYVVKNPEGKAADMLTILEDMTGRKERVS